jgi:phasin family protein
MATTTKTTAKTKAAPKAAPAQAFDATAAEEFWTKGAEKAQEQFVKAQVSVEEVTSFQRENVEVLVESASLAQKSFEALATESATFTQKSFEDGIEVAKKAMASATPQEAFELQTAFAKTAVEAYLGHVKKLGEMFQIGAQEVAAPINTRVTSLIETAQKV